VLARQTHDGLPSSGRSYWRNIFAIILIGYGATLAPAALVGLALDRYVLPVLPIVVILLLSHLQAAQRAVPKLAWISASIFASYSIVTTHDYFSSLRARAEAARRVEAAGVPRDLISAGFEYDGWTQLSFTERIGTPMPGSRVPQHERDQFWFWRYTTALQPKYVAVYLERPGHRNSHTTVPFTTWLPPFQRYVVVFRREDLRDNL
jgi:hypothetical protein